MTDQSSFSVPAYRSLSPEAMEAQIVRSWERSKQAGLQEHNDPGFNVLMEKQLKQQRKHRAPLLNLFQEWFLPKYGNAIKSSNARLMLSDAQGVILGAWGSEQFLPTAAQVALEPGVSWTEKDRGTNAIGTALAENSPSVVLGGNHYLESIRHVSCAASPILDGIGNISAVLDISGDNQNFSEQKVQLVQMMSLDLENVLLKKTFAHCDQVILSSGLNALSEGLLFFEHDQLVAANRVALNLFQLSIPWEGCAGEHLFADFDAIKDGSSAPQLSLSGNGQYLLTQFSPGQKPPLKKIAKAPTSTIDRHVEQSVKHAVIAVNAGIPLMVTGETGVGKEVLIGQVHQKSLRKQGPLVAVNCAALPEHLIESELFGYVGGAFTGANSQGSLGKIRQAQKGILFLDEIGELSLSMQVKLLRVLQDKQVTPLGSTQTYPVDFSLAAATLKDMETEVNQGNFREDLYFRLNGVEVNLPPLRERSDLLTLIAQLLRKHDAQKSLSPELLQHFSEYHWPGNLRELDHTLHVASAFSQESKVIQWEHLPANLRRKLAKSPGKPTVGNGLEEQTHQILLKTYQKHEGNISQTAKALGVSRNTLYRRLRKAGIEDFS